VAFEGSPLPRAEVTGAPVRRAVLEVDRAADRDAARAALGLPTDRFVVGVMGGSLGSGLLNEAASAYVADHARDAGLAVRQVAGERFAADVETVHGGEDGVLHQVVGFEDDMPALYAAVDLLVGRGGASTVHEVAVTGTPAILVPWSGAAEDHQTDNVRWLAERGAAVLLREADIDRLPVEIERLRHDSAAREALATAARERGEVHRSGALARLIERVAVTSGAS
jgi:UDP-N-acetylglucosamine--N-acetylmuramyl-(pentapeptide) pyrophosphoryl-undecaprenol N-acetylglucosamine transferase